ncbi:type VI secretion system baseplate subunit TssG [Trinickia soli]|uniref:type VI secretion system baseplate subunit TssG n=1 Tax=Trinickia soli TaxID=380675 RepID=UPI001253B8CA|nr:type VI secretion system baseplate subunit TssG [Paraburkholderia sp. T12-10]
MPTTKRRITADMIRQMFRKPHAFGFFQLVRLLEHWYKRHTPGASRDVPTEKLFFRNTVSLSFAPSEVERMQLRDADGALLDGYEDVSIAVAQDQIERIGRIEVTPAFFGLLGVHGALPLHYTEQTAGRESLKREFAARAFLDVFSNRATALFWSAWKKYRLPFHYRTDQDEHYLPRMLALAGVADSGTRTRLRSGRGAFLDETIASHAHATRHWPMSSVYLQQTLSEYFGVPVQVKPLAGRRYSVPRNHLSGWTQSGGMNMTLGATALAGERVWQCDIGVQLLIGPLSKRDYEAFLPGFDRAVALRRLLTMLAGVTAEYEVSLVLRRAEVNPARLGGSGRLGWDAFLCTQDPRSDRADVCYELPANQG